MTTAPIIQRIELSRYRIPTYDLASDVSFAMGQFYQPGAHGSRTRVGIKIYTDQGVTGEYMSGAPAAYEQMLIWVNFLIGKSALERERFYNQAKSILRKNDRMGVGPIDVALWDLAGKYHNAPIYQLLGGHRKKLPCYASTYHADREPDGLSSPEAYADFAEQCLQMGYPGFKIHSWGEVDINREIATVRAVGERVGGKMAMMTDPCCVYDTFADTLAVGRACDEYNYYWYEDPMRDGGVSFWAHKQLKKMIKTPLLQGEHLHLVEAHTDMAIAEATDFWRADVEYDGGITGVMKIAHAAEGFGMDLELHISNPPHRHCMAAIRNSNFNEMGLVHPKIVESGPRLYKSDYADQIDSIDKDGNVSVPEGPGLGVEYDWKGLEQYRLDTVVIE